VYRYLRHKSIAQAHKSLLNNGFWNLRADAQGCLGRGTEVFARAATRVATTMREIARVTPV
jgi:hypothetical protein